MRRSTRPAGSSSFFTTIYGAPTAGLQFGHSNNPAYAGAADQTISFHMRSSGAYPAEHSRNGSADNAQVGEQAPVCYVGGVQIGPNREGHVTSP